MEQDDSFVVIEARRGLVETRQLIGVLRDRRPTLWIGDEQARSSSWKEMGLAGEARFWVTLGDGEDQNQQTIAAPYVSGLVCHRSVLQDLCRTIPPVGTRPPLFFTDTRLVWNRYSAQNMRHGRFQGCDCDREALDGGVIVLPEDLPISHGRHQHVAVIADSFSGDYRPNSDGTAMIGLMSSYLSIGADQIVVSAKSMLRHPDPLKAYDKLYEFIAKKRQAKAA